MWTVCPEGGDLLDDVSANRIVADKEIVWYQKFRLSENVMSPGERGIEWLLNKAGLPQRLDGMTVLDIGTTNGGAAFISEQRGAKRVVAVDIVDQNHFGFTKIKSALGSNVEYVRSSIYELPQRLDEQFDFVLCLGVLYHLRHPLLGVDSLRALTRGQCLVETAICGTPNSSALAEFYRFDELSKDFSNWYAPTVKCLSDWMASSGFIVDRTEYWPEENPERAIAVGRPDQGAPEYVRVSYEVPLKILVARESS